MARIVLAKIGIDAHDNGVTVVAAWLRDAGHEVIYAGLYNTPERLLEVAVEEDAELVGASFHCGDPVHLSGRVLELMRAHDLAHVPFVVGGVLTPEMRLELEGLGVAAVFTPGTRRDAVVEGIAEVLAGAKRG